VSEEVKTPFERPKVGTEEEEMPSMVVEPKVASGELEMGKVVSAVPSFERWRPVKAKAEDRVFWLSSKAVEQPPNTGWRPSRDIIEAEVWKVRRSMGNATKAT
jgi:hypothetical protein